jgi:putative ABC transport system permease protein
VNSIAGDFRYAFRTFRARPGLISVIVLTLAIGIGATTSIFSIVHTVILSPLPFREPERLVHIWEGSKGDRYQPGQDSSFIYARPGSFFDWRAQSASFESTSAYAWRKMIVTANEGADMLWAQEVTDNFFETLGASAVIGRTFNAPDYRPNAPRIVLLSFRVWADRFGKDTRIVGRVISLDREQYQVAGVMPAGFYPTGSDSPDLWIPHWYDEKERDDRTSWRLTTFGRLKSGITLSQAQSEMDVVTARMAADHPRVYENMGAVLVPVDKELIGSSWKWFVLLSAGVTVLLLIACVNVANLLLSRAVDREKEFSVRNTLGATRGRLLLQLFTENTVLAVFSGGLGTLLAFVGTRTLIRLVPQAAHLPRLDSVTIDFAVLALVSAIALGASFAFSVLPLARLSRIQPLEALKVEGRGASLGRNKRRLGQFFIVSEFALSLVLLIVGALLVQSFLKLQRVDPGFQAGHLLTLQIQVPEFRYGKYVTGGRNAPREQLYERLERHLATLPGIESVALSAKLPMKHDFDPWAVNVEGREPPAPGTTYGDLTSAETPGFIKHGDTSIQRVNPKFFRTLGLKLRSGRFLEESDTAEAPMVAVVNETFAKAFFATEDAVGKRVTVDYTSWFPKVTIVGVVADFKINSLDRNPQAEMFWSLWQTPSENVWVLARTNQNPESAGASLRQEIHQVGVDLPVLQLESMAGVIADSLWRSRFSALLIGFVAALSILLAVTGIYSVMSYSVSQRTKELGIRIALGADKARIFSLVMGETLRLSLVGVALGSLTAFVAGRLAAAQLFQVGGNDPVTFLVTSISLIAVAMAASYVPARRAVKVDPMFALQ